MSWWPPRELALEIAPPSARVSDYRVSREAYPAWKPNMPSAVALETLTSSSAISTCRPSGHSNVGHHDINAVPFGASVLSCVTLHCDT